MAGNPNNPKDHGHELDPPSPRKVREDGVLHERIAREKDPSGPVAGHGDPEHEHDHGGTQKRRRRR